MEAGFNEVDGGGSPTKGISPSKTETISTNINPKGGKPSSKSIKKRNPGTKKNDEMCQFCGKIDKTYLQNDNLDMHYWKECPMLTECTHCKQVIEIAGLNEHLLRECDSAKSFKQCPRCKESVHSIDYETHVGAKECPIAKPSKAANRCPLCHKDIESGEKGWK